MILIYLLLLETSFGCVHGKPSPGWQDHLTIGFRNRWGLVAVAFLAVVLIIITLVVLM